ncbi:Putative transcriptional regulator protein YobU [Chlamydiales bacterium SCGC AG-110-M15]|nr:Putative transcriptional regulator protein YobU [Chlamydiales bacterium SCGC AG-110-M15]
MNQAMIALDTKKFAGIELRTINEEGKADVDIPKLWGRFFEENIGAQILNKSSEKIYALYTNYEGDHTQPYTVIIAYEVDEMPKNLAEGLVFVEVPKASYAHFPVEGKFPESCVVKWQEIWNSDLKRAFVADFEVYDESFDMMSGDSSGLSILIGLKA